MSSRAARLAIIAGALAAATATAARAQDVPQVISPLRIEADYNGVNLVDGKTEMDGPALTIAAAPNLRFDRPQNAAPYVSGRVISGGPEQTNTRTYSVHAGTGTSDSFQCVDYDCTSIAGSGSTFRWNANVYRQAGSGAEWHFNVPHVTGQSTLYYASHVDYPNGESISYEYQTVALTGDPLVRLFRRPVTITSNMGYAISLTYQGNDLEADANAWAAVATATLHASTPSAPPLRRLTYSGATITDSGGTVTDTSDDRTFTCQGCANGLSLEIEVAAGSMQLPGEATPAHQVAQIADKPLVQSVTRDGVQWNYAYTGLQYQSQTQSWLYTGLTVTGPNGFSQAYAVAQMGLSNSKRNAITGVTDSIGRTTAYGYDEFYRHVQVTSPEGTQVTITYDDAGNIVQRRQIARPGTGLADIVETADYTLTPLVSLCTVSCWRPNWRRDAMGRQTDYLYNGNGQLIEQTEPPDVAGANGVRRRTIVEYAPSPVAGISRRSAVRVCWVGTTCGTSQEIRTEYLYLGDTMLVTRERRIDPATGATLDTDYGYDAEGRLTSTDGPLPGSADATYNRYDLFGRRNWEIGAADANGVRTATRTTYRNADDKPVSVETGTLANAASSDLQNIRRTDLVYDGRRNPIRETVSAAGTTFGLVQRSFDDRGQPVCEARRMNPALFATPPADPCLPGAQGTGANDFGPDRIARNIYDAAGQRVQRRVGVGSGVEAAEATWAYNLNGQITTVIDGNGNRAALTYDGHMRQNCWMFPSTTRPSSYDDATQASALASAGNLGGTIVGGQCTSGDYEAYSYNAVGSRLTLRKRDGSVLSYQYDNLNRMIRKIVPERGGLDPSSTRDVYYGYDLRDQPLYARFDSATGPGIVNTYDAFGRLASTTTNVVGGARTLSYQYDAAGRRTRITHPDGAFFTLEYDPASRVTGIDQLGNSDVLSLNYHPTGERYVLGRGLTALGWLYDPVGRMTYQVADLAGDASDTNWTFLRNPASGIAGQTRSNDAYAWTGHYAVNRSYQTNGLNQYSGTTSGPGNAAFTYDLNGNLITTPGPNGQTITYTYDVENRLVAASGGVQLAYDPLGRLAWTTGSPNFTSFLYDGDDLIAEYDYGGTITERYVHGPGADEPWLWYHGAAVDHASLRLPFADAQGSVVATTTYLGNMLSINRYDEYGIPASTNSGRFQYTGQIWLAELGMYYYKARIYSPTLGRFLQTDPVGYEDQFNLYAYVGNDPVNRADPAGTSCTVTTGSRGQQSASCQIDRVMGADGEMRDATAPDHRRYSRYEKAYTRAVNRLLANRNRTQTITTRAPGSGPGSDIPASSRTFTTSAGALADELIAVQISALPNENVAIATSAPGQPRMPGEPTDNTIMYVGRSGLAGGPVQGVPDLGFEKNIGLQLTHDAMHPRADNGLAFNPEEVPWRRLHQVPYNEAARWFLGY